MNSLIENWILEAVRRQPFYKRYANTIVAAIGALAAVLSFVATLPLDIDERWSGALPAVISVLTMIGIKLTKNGIAPSAVDKVRPVADEQPAPRQEQPLSTYTGASSVPSVTPNSSGLPVYQMASSAIEAVNDTRVQIETAVNDVLGQAQGAADRAHALAAEYTGRHRGE